jgi:hypothetical protein
MTPAEALVRVTAFEAELENYSKTYPTADAVVARIKELGIKGAPCCPFQCIIAKLFEREFGGRLSIGTVTIWLPEPGSVPGSDAWVDLPAQFSAVVRDFDNGKYPELEELP